MIYKKFQDINLSRLGMGNMRLPVSRGRIDEKRAQEIIDYAMAQGINYYDTAYVYHSGESESFLGKALKKYPRDSYYLATKFYVMADPDIEKVFEEQLRKLDTDYIDFYLLHCVNEETCDAYMKPERKYLDFLMEQKAKGRIRHIGFSSHGKPATLERFLNWSDCFEFVQIQLNYLDWTMQDAKKQYEIITEHGLPVWVMEPVRGGRLASLGREHFKCGCGHRRKHHHIRQQNHGKCTICGVSDPGAYPLGYFPHSSAGGISNQTYSACQSGVQRAGSGCPPGHQKPAEKSVSV